MSGSREHGPGRSWSREQRAYARAREKSLDPSFTLPFDLGCTWKSSVGSAGPGGSLAGSARRAGTCQGKWHGGAPVCVHTPVPALENAAPVGSRDHQPSEDGSHPYIIGQSGTMEEHQEKTEGTRSLSK